MTKRLIVAVVLSIAVLFISDLFLRRIYRKKIQTTGQEQQAQGLQQVPSPAPKTKEGESNLSVAPGASKKRETVKTSSEFYEVVFSPDGAILHWYLKTYKEKDGTLIDLAAGSKQTSDYKYEVFPLEGEEGVLLHTIADGVEITKKFTFNQKNHKALIDFKIINNSTHEKDVSVFKWGPGVGGATQKEDAFIVQLFKKQFGGKESPERREFTITSWTKKGVTRWKAHKIKDTIRQDWDTQWTGLGEKYFAAALVPASSEQQRLLILKESDGISIQSVVEKIPPGARIEGKLMVYAGPRDEKVLKAAGEELQALINHGSIGKIIFFLLKWFYSITRNYGVAIILLSALIKIILFPLSRASLKSMGGMQKIQPQIAMLKQRFKYEPEKLNQETMELYKRMKINPMGGCLPMVFQLPIFWALFTVLRDAIELRHAPFMFWIKDLSSPDFLSVLPLLMGFTTFIQQKMTATDRQQSTMTYFMTIFLTFIFLNFPAGLVLYWLITNILSIGEQRLIAKMS